MRANTFFSLCLFLCCTLCAQAADRKVIRITSTSGEEESYDNFLYNSENQLIWVQSSTNSTRDVYTYDEKGLLLQKTTLSWIAANKQYKELNRETYTYDDNGMVKTMDRLTSIGTSFQRHYVFSDYKYKDGKAIFWHMEDIRESNTYKYDYQVITTLDEQGRVVTENVEELDYDYPEDGFCAYEGSAFTYKDNGEIDTEVRTTYNYAYDKIRKSENYTYTYADLAPKYAPTGLKANVKGAEVVLSWEAVEGASSYVLTFDMQRQTVQGTSYAVKDISIGDHEFAVQAVIDGVERNASTPILVSANDPGKKAAENLIAGEPRKSIEDTDEGTPRTFYIVPLTWTIPQGHSEIKEIRIYYTSVIHGTVYQAVGDNRATSYSLKLDEYDVRQTDSEGVYTNGADIDIYVTLVYGSGESEASNVVTLNPYNLANGITEPDAIHSLSASPAAKQFTVGGTPVKENYRGIIISNGKKVIKN